MRCLGEGETLGTFIQEGNYEAPCRNLHHVNEYRCSDRGKCLLQHQEEVGLEAGAVDNPVKRPNAASRYRGCLIYFYFT